MKPLLSLIGLLLAGAIALTAQPASIRGRVTDPSGKSMGGRLRGIYLRDRFRVFKSRKLS